mmetsp:Transcript_8911/g.28289  ORF Transcript_8911/g.28289 Transcript_8911/m.28289 type:complete len:157 (+) Transcript_8911:470-940(+)
MMRRLEEQQQEEQQQQEEAGEEGAHSSAAHPQVPLTADTVEGTLRRLDAPALRRVEAAGGEWGAAAKAVSREEGWQAERLSCRELLACGATASSLRARLAAAPHEAREEWPGGRGWIALHHAAAKAGAAEVRVLLGEHRGGAAKSDKLGRLPLHLA